MGVVLLCQRRRLSGRRRWCGTLAASSPPRNCIRHTPCAADKSRVRETHYALWFVPRHPIKIHNLSVCRIHWNSARGCCWRPPYGLRRPPDGAGSARPTWFLTDHLCPAAPPRRHRKPKGELSNNRPKGKNQCRLSRSAATNSTLALFRRQRRRHRRFSGLDEQAGLSSGLDGPASPS